MIGLVLDILQQRVKYTDSERPRVNGDLKFSPVLICNGQLYSSKARYI